jgi:hypothetical protein
MCDRPPRRRSVTHFTFHSTIWKTSDLGDFWFCHFRSTSSTRHPGASLSKPNTHSGLPVPKRPRPTNTSAAVCLAVDPGQSSLAYVSTTTALRFYRDAAARAHSYPVATHQLLDYKRSLSSECTNSLVTLSIFP